MPALVLLGLLLVSTGFLWSKVFETSEDIEAATRCNAPGMPTSPSSSTPVTNPSESTQLGRMLPRTSLDRTAPIPPQDVQVRVLNGNGESRQASLVSEELSGFGFAEGGPAANDPIYPNYDLHCNGQIRFGSAGVSAARTLSLIVPCAQLVRDERQDPGVDLALGSEFDDIKTSTDAKRVLQELKDWIPQRDHQGSAQQDVSRPPISNDRINEARDVHC